MNPPAQADVDAPVVSVKALANNGLVVKFVRSLMFVYAGGVAGTLGLTGLQGFAMYVIVYLLVSVAMAVRMGGLGKVKKFFPSSPISFVTGGIFGQLVTFILFWTLAYALVHLY